MTPGPRSRAAAFHQNKRDIISKKGKILQKMTIWRICR
jgi:hypothetical protein